MIKDLLKLNGIAQANVFALGAGEASLKPGQMDLEALLDLPGIAAIAYTAHHYRAGQTPSGARETADLKRGYRDSLHAESEGPHLRPQAMQGCDNVVATNFGGGIHDAHSTRTVQRVPNDLPVKSTAGQKYFTCVIGIGGEAVEVTGGGMQ
jgi:hypothetical protein